VRESLLDRQIEPLALPCTKVAIPSPCPNEVYETEMRRAPLEDLPAEIDPCGENGEFHTFVTDGPIFGVSIPVRPGEVVERDGFAPAIHRPRRDGTPSRLSEPIATTLRRG
jgi:hypothetical protein